LFQLYERGPFLIFAVIVIVAIILLRAAVRILERLEARALSAASEERDAAKPEQDNTAVVRYQRLKKMHRVVYPVVSGVIGGQTVLFAKCSSELLVNTFQGNGFLFAYYQTYLVLFMMFFTTI